MHPVIEHILEREQKQVPIDDGRKIALVLHGGLMTCVRGCAAMIGLEELGLSHAFDVIYSVSAGFGNASYLLSEQAALGTSVYYEELSGNKFINFWKPWNVVKIDKVIYAMENTKPLDVEKVWESKTKLFVRLWNSKTKRIEYLEIHSFPSEMYSTLLKAAMYVQYAVPGSVRINGTPYMDGEFISKNSIEHDEHDRSAIESDATDILIIYNNLYQPPKEIQENDRVCIIAPDPAWDLSRLETRTDVLKQAAFQMGTLIKKTFGNSEPVNIDYHDRH